MERHALESLASPTKLHSQVIEAWCALMNFEERLRSRESIRRYFFSLEVMDDVNLRSTPYTHKTHYNLFRKSLLSSTKNNWDVVNMRDIDLAFFPMVQDHHFYLVVFNLKSPSIVIIDNHRRHVNYIEDLIKMYKGVSDILQCCMIKHLTSIGHAAASFFAENSPERLVMQWQTDQNIDDSGVFLMRHMETYMGDLRTW
ncbi:hypothetical protein OSB04_001391 [Centaurea solstitialis]|uniref:Ubiquitin-like protease family profile domain-containing protein n=1 Tax=Centaurea solstitialis TaxID=347529 RepID=A0AA38TQX9_9ASTR|nr:hypothetical protein OSB04_001391 [Centaurea solstitialis]